MIEQITKPQGPDTSTLEAVEDGSVATQARVGEFEQTAKKLPGCSRAARAARAAVEQQKQQIIAKMSPDELATPLLQRRKAGWVNLPGHNRSLLVERGTGCMVVAPRGRREAAIARPKREPIRFKTDIALDEFLEKLEDFEDITLHMYLDRKGNVTVGYGHLIPSAEAAKALGFVERGTNIGAAAEHVENAFDKVKNSGLVNTRAEVFKTLTHIDLPPEEVRKLFESDASGFLRELRHIFSDFDSFPQKAKWGTLDLIYNLGGPKFRSLFKRFQAAVKERNWKAAAAQSKRSETDEVGEPIQGVVDRNITVRDWFLRAALDEPFFLKRHPRACQIRWQDLLK